MQSLNMALISSELSLVEVGVGPGVLPQIGLGPEIMPEHGLEPEPIGVNDRLKI